MGVVQRSRIVIRLGLSIAHLGVSPPVGTRVSECIETPEKKHGSKNRVFLSPLTPDFQRVN